MKAAFGLAGILVTLGVIVWLMGSSGGTLDQAKTAIDTKRQLETSTITGRNEDGTRIGETVAFEPMRSSGGKVTGLLVTSIGESNALATKYGLKQFDRIDKVNNMSFDALGIEPETQVLEAPVRGWTLQVTRGTTQLTLPQAPQGPSPTAQPGQPAAPQPAPPSGNPLQRQLDSIQRTPTH
jgi:hypothetical protein